MLIDEQVDHGDIIIQKEVKIDAWPVGFMKLQEILASEGSKLLREVLPDWIRSRIQPQKQNDSLATFTKKVGKNDGLIDLNDNQYKNYLKILAYEDWPKTYFYVEKNNQKIRVIIKKAIFENSELKIQSVIPEGKKEMSYADFLRGLNK
jgi:methionyl-tRNA formyltransferase